MENDNWKLYPQNLTLREEIARSLSISKTTAQILINRGIASKEEAIFFLEGGLNDLHNPFLMKDMDKAVERVFKAKKDNEKVLVFGDYDADGVTATSLLLIALREFGITPSFYIPNRLTEGYGLNPEIIKKSNDEGFSLLITADTGINSFREIDLAGEIGLDLIVTDHHLPDSTIPDGFAILNPRQHECNYPFKELAGVGVAYKFARAFLGDKCSEELLNELIILSAFGTVADVASLTGENRILVKEGLWLMKGSRIQGFKDSSESRDSGDFESLTSESNEFTWIEELIKISGFDKKELTSWHVGFLLAPMVNAAGRLGSANYCVNLMTTKKKDVAQKITKFLDKENRTRQSIEKKILEEAKEKIEKSVDLENERVIVLSDEKWHPGILGIVASRISESYSRPAVLIGDNGKGSARSAVDFNIYKALKHCSQYLKSYGGHKSAAGLTIEKEKIKQFCHDINRYGAENLSVKDLALTLWADCEIDFSDISFSLIEEIQKLAPFGIANPEPNLISSNIRIEGEPRIVGKDHLKLKIIQDSTVFNSIGFKMGGSFDIGQHSETYQVIYSPSFNNWNGRKEIQLKLKGLRKLNQ